MLEKRCKPLVGSPDHVRRRVAYRIVERFYRYNPSMFQPYPPSGVLEIAEHFRRHFPPLYPELAWYARNMAAGFTLKELRDSGWEYANRALTKRKPRPPTRYD